MGASVGKSSGAKNGRRRRRHDAPMAEINVTPFVDVMLVLLIIFMATAPLLTAGVPLDLPKTKAESLPSEAKPPVSVSVDTQGKVYLGDAEVPLNDLPTALAEQVADPAEDRVYLRADSASAYGQVMQVMGLLAANGFANIGLVTDRATPPAVEQ